MSTAIGTATRIWESNITFEQYAQCAVWDPSTKSVHIWECIKPHHSTPGTEPPNAKFWRFLGRR